MRFFYVAGSFSCVTSHRSKEAIRFGAWLAGVTGNLITGDREASYYWANEIMSSRTTHRRYFRY